MKVADGCVKLYSFKDVSASLRHDNYTVFIPTILYSLFTDYTQLC